MNAARLNDLSFFKRLALRRGAFFGAILLLALFAFEVFNYSTTEYALSDMLGTNLSFWGIRWATILSIAFCGIDFAGIARLFTPEQVRDEPREVWYLLGAWFLAAGMNAILTWWGVAVAIRSHRELATLVIGQATLTRAVPVFVAVMVWLIRVLIIGTFSMSGDRWFSVPTYQFNQLGNTIGSLRSQSPSLTSNLSRPGSSPSVPFHPSPKPELSYHPVGMSAGSNRSRVNIQK